MMIFATILERLPNSKVTPEMVKEFLGKRFLSLCLRRTETNYRLKSFGSLMYVRFVLLFVLFQSLLAKIVTVL